jgi:hypothetical protein
LKEFSKKADKQMHKLSHISQDTFMSDKVNLLLHVSACKVSWVCSQGDSCVQTYQKYQKTLKTITINRATAKTSQMQSFFIVRTLNKAAVNEIRQEVAGLLQYHI